jgi:hypothetical protein
MYQQLMPGVYVGVPTRCILDEEALAAAREWWALCVALDLDPVATAQGVVTEIRNLRAQLAGYLILDGQPAVYEVVSR